MISKRPLGSKGENQQAVAAANATAGIHSSKTGSEGERSRDGLEPAPLVDAALLSLRIRKDQRQAAGRARKSK
jgi:hypothetical protein